MKKKILLTLLSITAATACSMGIAACSDKTTQNTDGEQPITVQTAYSVATTLGYSGTAEEFASALNRTDEVLKVELNDDGELIVYLTDGSFINLGVIETGCNHTYSDWTVGVEPNCTSIGYNQRECTKCGDIDYEFLEAEGHTGESFTYNQSCHFFVCADCGQSVEEEHNFVGNVCTVCGYEADYTLGLKYEFNEQTQSYTVTGLSDRDSLSAHGEIIIPCTYKNYPVSGINEKAFIFLDNLEKIVIPDSVLEIGAAAFAECSGLQNVTLPKNLTKIPNGLFTGCTALQSVEIPNSVTSIGYGVFLKCEALKNVTLPEGLTQLTRGIFANCTSLQSVNIPEGVTAIGMSAFLRCESLTEIDIPESVVTLAEYAFYGCTSLTEVTVPEGVTTVGGSAFRDCSNLEKITLPESLVSLGLGVETTGNKGYAFAGCISLTEIVLPDGLTTLGGHAFENCQSLAKITIPSSLTQIGEYVFNNCPALTSVTFSEGLTQLSGNMFSNCINLTEIILPESLTHICAGALLNCDKITVITFNGTTEQWKAIEKESGWRTEDNIITNLKVSCSDGELEYIW